MGKGGEFDYESLGKETISKAASLHKVGYKFLKKEFENGGILYNFLNVIEEREKAIQNYSILLGEVRNIREKNDDNKIFEQIDQTLADNSKELSAISLLKKNLQGIRELEETIKKKEENKNLSIDKLYDTAIANKINELEKSIESGIKTNPSFFGSIKNFFKKIFSRDNDQQLNTNLLNEKTAQNLANQKAFEEFLKSAKSENKFPLRDEATKFLETNYEARTNFKYKPIEERSKQVSQQSSAIPLQQNKSVNIPSPPSVGAGVPQTLVPPNVNNVQSEPSQNPVINSAVYKDGVPPPLVQPNINNIPSQPFQNPVINSAVSKDGVPPPPPPPNYPSVKNADINKSLNIQQALEQSSKVLPTQQQVEPSKASQDNLSPSRPSASKTTITNNAPPFPLGTEEEKLSTQSQLNVGGPPPPPPIINAPLQNASVPTPSKASLQVNAGGSLPPKVDPKKEELGENQLVANNRISNNTHVKNKTSSQNLIQKQEADKQENTFLNVWRDGIRRAYKNVEEDLNTSYEKKADNNVEFFDFNKVEVKMEGFSNENYDHKLNLLHSAIIEGKDNIVKEIITVNKENYDESKSDISLSIDTLRQLKQRIIDDESKSLTTEKRIALNNSLDILQQEIDTPNLKDLAKNIGTINSQRADYKPASHSKINEPLSPEEQAKIDKIVKSLQDTMNKAFNERKPNLIEDFMKEIKQDIEANKGNIKEKLEKTVKEFITSKNDDLSLRIQAESISKVVKEGLGILQNIGMRMKK